MKRILHVVPDMRSGGLETFIMNMYRNIDRNQIQFDFLVHYTQEGFYDKEIEELGGKIYRLSFREDNNIFKYFKDLKTFFSEHKEYNVVHGHMGSLAVFYLKYAKKYGVDTRIIHSHNTDTEKTFKGHLKKMLLGFSSKYANVLFACSEEAGHFLFGNKKFHVINNAIISERFSYNEATRIKIRQQYNVNDKFIIGHVGRFCQQKNHKFLIDIFASIASKTKNTELWLIGTGELEKDIQDYAIKIGIADNIKFLGTKKNVEDYYQAMDVFVLPSQFEGLGIVNIEAQVSGLKCVISDQVPKIVDVTGNVDFVSLEKSADEWANVILSYQSYERRNCQKNVIDAGFDMGEETIKIQNFYINPKALFETKYNKE